MLTFAQFLTEKLFAGVERGRGYLEVWKNPTAKELSTLSSEAAQDAWDRNAELGGWLVGTVLYVWDRGKFTHSDARGAIEEEGGTVNSSSIPLYLRPKRGGSLRVRVSDWSSSDDVQKIPDRTVLAKLRAHPSLKLFSTINTDN